MGLVLLGGLGVLSFLVIHKTGCTSSFSGSGKYEASLQFPSLKPSHLLHADAYEFIPDLNHEKSGKFGKPDLFCHKTLNYEQKLTIA
jgi:hypothetical protein